ncbi:MAG: DnaJ C-terminal domain-containing protein [Candidatus Eremiobacterota bacterium]
MDFKDYYKILGTDRNATDKDIKKAYRKLARQLHPDINPGDPKAEERFKELNEAYEVLSDPAKREKYDLLGQNWKNGNFNKGRYSGEGVSDFFRNFRTSSGKSGATSFSGFGDFSDFFNTFFRNGTDNFGGDFFNDTGTGARRDLEYQIEITMREAYNGTEKSFQVQRQEKCSSCYGTGRTNNNLCRNCGGSGMISTSRQIETKIPPGVRNGSRIRLRGEGEIGRDGTRGDMYLKVKLMPHDFFELKENDLYCVLPVTVTEAALGAEIKVPSLNGKDLQMKIPPETQNGRKFRLSGMGMPNLKEGLPGNMIVEVKIVMPQGLTEREKELFAEMACIRRDNPRVYIRN